MTDQMIRALTIAASVFFAVATVSAGIIYYTTVADVTEQYNERADISKSYEYTLVKNIENKFNQKEKITGIDARNLIYTLQDMKEFSINIVNTNNQVVSANLNNNLVNKDGSIKMIEIQKLIHPNAVITVKLFEKINKILNINICIEN